MEVNSQDMIRSKTITIFSQRLAGYLMLKGFVLADMRIDKYGSGKNLFFFKDSDEIHKAINDYKCFNYCILK